jgi:hypothetical protein
MKKKFFDLNRIEKDFVKFLEQGNQPLLAFSVGTRVCVLYKTVVEKQDKETTETEQ